VRKQILVPAALDKKIRRLARKRGISQSALVVEAVEALLDGSDHADHMLSLEHHIVAFDLRCHGHSDDGAWSWDNALADIAAVADHLQLTNWGMRLRQSGHRGRPAERSSSTLPSSAPPGFAFCVRSGTND